VRVSETSYSRALVEKRRFGNFSLPISGSQNKARKDLAETHEKLNLILFGTNSLHITCSQNINLQYPLTVRDHFHKYINKTENIIIRFLDRRQEKKIHNK
jgi:hypothetical protein